MSHLVLDAANIVISTANSPDIERLVEAREQFDWVVVEEAAKATGPELIGPLMLSGRRLLIGDHYQLPPFEADRLVKILTDHSLVSEALKIAEQLIGPLLRDGELDELDAVPPMLRGFVRRPTWLCGCSSLFGRSSRMTSGGRWQIQDTGGSPPP